MHEIPDSQAAENEHDDGLVDVTSLPLGELVGSDDDVLSNAASRVLAELQHPHQVIAGWSSHLR